MLLGVIALTQSAVEDLIPRIEPLAQDMPVPAKILVGIQFVPGGPSLTEGTPP
jgi:hypothetical protein